MKTRLFYLIFVLLTIFSVSAQELVVCTYNVRYKNSGDNDAGNGWSTRYKYLVNFVNFQQPDLLGVQEATNAQMNDMASGLKGYAYIGVGRNDGKTSGEYSAIFYRTARMVVLDHGDFWLSDTPWKPSKGFPSKGGGTSYYRICTWGKFLDKATGSVIYHFNTHMDLDETNRQQSYYLFRQKIQEIASTTAPVIITGDYNAVQTGEAYKLFYNSGVLFDCFHRTKQKFMTNGTCPGFDANNYSTAGGELRRIDHIFVTRTFNVEHYGVLNPCYFSTSGTASYHERAYSDHSPVIAKLTIKNPEMADLPAAPKVVGGFYQIASPEDLQAFSYIVNGITGYTQNTAAKAVLLNDIDMAGMTSWLPMGTESKPFKGTFDGQGYAIRNIVIKAGKNYSGLFGYTSGATIKNFSIDGTLTVPEGYGEHGTVGYASATTITNVHSALDITAAKANTETKHIGGIAGSLFAASTVGRCSYSGKLNDAGTNTIGGIAGYADGTANTISNAINYGTVTTKGSATNTGGILGYVNYAGFQISRCVNVGNVSGDPTYAGQIIGRQLKAMTTAPSLLFYLDGASLSAFGSGTDQASATGATAVDAETLASGEVCYKLNEGATSEGEDSGDQTVINWYQTIGEDPYPVLDSSHGIVTFQDGTYTGIEAASNRQQTTDSSPIYNLAGQRLSKMQKGINIVNGRKVLK